MGFAAICLRNLAFFGVVGTSLENVPVRRSPRGNGQNAGAVVHRAPEDTLNGVRKGFGRPVFLIWSMRGMSAKGGFMSDGEKAGKARKKTAPASGKFMATAFPRGFAYLQSWARTLKTLIIKVRHRPRSN